MLGEELNGQYSNWYLTTLLWLVILAILAAKRFDEVVDPVQLLLTAPIQLWFSCCLCESVRSIEVLQLNFNLILGRLTAVCQVM